MNDRKEISEAIRAAHLYLDRLKGLNGEIQDAELQINNTSRETENQTRLDGLAPLEECRTDITKKMDKTRILISEGECLLNGVLKNAPDFDEKSSLLGSLPEIPELKEVPYISFQFESNVQSDLIDICSNFGEVSPIAPVQISQMNERPGAILVEWQSIEIDERCRDVQEYRLQRAYGNVLVEKHLLTNFSDCFIGSDTQFLVKELQINQPYSFRVCCKFEGSNEWSPWSVIQVASTAINSYCWKKNDGFYLADDNRIASPIKNAPSLLLSNGPQFSIGFSVEFTYLEFDDKESIIGLIVYNSDLYIKEIRDADQYFVVNSQGEICVDGAKKSTLLPKATKGLKVCFTCESLQNDKIRINIDSCDKRVTYYWHINNTNKLYFAAQVSSTGCKIMVE